MTEFEKYQVFIGILEGAGAILIPFAIAAFGLLFHRYKTALESRFEHERETFGRRFMKFEEISSLANDIYCFQVLVGHYRQIQPPSVIEKKRQLEALVFATLPLWNDRFANALMRFLDVCFKTQRGTRQNVASAADVQRHKTESASSWDASWDAFFLEPAERQAYLSEITSSDFSGSYRNAVVKPAYAEFLSALSESVGGGLSESVAFKLLNPDN